MPLKYHLPLYAPNQPFLSFVLSKGIRHYTSGSLRSPNNSTTTVLTVVRSSLRTCSGCLEQARLCQVSIIIQESYCTGSKCRLEQSPPTICMYKESTVQTEPRSEPIRHRKAALHPKSGWKQEPKKQTCGRMVRKLARGESHLPHVSHLQVSQIKHVIQADATRSKAIHSGMQTEGLRSKNLYGMTAVCYAAGSRRQLQRKCAIEGSWHAAPG